VYVLQVGPEGHHHCLPLRLPLRFRGDGSFLDEAVPHAEQPVTALRRV
jgi:hypothetical protein